jgi:hypothetical protein
MLDPDERSPLSRRFANDSIKKRPSLPLSPSLPHRGFAALACILPDAFEYIDKALERTGAALRTFGRE